MMMFLRIFRRDPDALERAKQADVEAAHRLNRAMDNAAWARRTLATNHLTDRFYAGLRHGGKI